MKMSDPDCSSYHASIEDGFGTSAFIAMGLTVTSETHAITELVLLCLAPV